MAEEEGYLLTFVYNSKTDKSEMWIMDAETMDSNPLCKVAIAVMCSVVWLEELLPCQCCGVLLGWKEVRSLNFLDTSSAEGALWISRHLGE